MHELDPHKRPEHVAIIMDGNGRWATAQGMNRVKGHQAGAKAMRAITQEARRLGIPYLTLFAFSSENWSRPKAEVQALMRLLSGYLKNELDTMLENQVRLGTIGQTERLPKTVSRLLEQAMERTRENNAMVLTLALSYGGQQDILAAAAQAARLAVAGELDPASLDEKTFERLLWTRDMPPVDLVIRTSGELRLSNFMLWQTAYAEFFFTPTLWPDFDEPEFREILAAYARRQRRFGQTGAQVEKT